MGTEGLQDRYINPYTDFGFKLLFGTDMNKDLLVSFLNALLFGKEEIKKVNYLNTEHLGTQEYDRRAVFDVYCENEKGEKILVEMQRGEQQFFKDRSVYYATFPIREQAPRGEWNYELKGVYVIGILNFIFQDGDTDCFHHQVKLVDLHTHEVFYDKLTFIYLEMPKFNKSESELESMFDKWMFVLRNLSGLLYLLQNNPWISSVSPYLRLLAHDLFPVLFSNPLLALLHNSSAYWCPEHFSSLGSSSGFPSTHCDAEV